MTLSAERPAHKPRRPAARMMPHLLNAVGFMRVLAGACLSTTLTSPQCQRHRQA
jgi:hypothetical protein